jgi:hypothetical protein
MIRFATRSFSDQRTCHAHALHGLDAVGLFQLLANKALHRTPPHCVLGAGERRC